MTSRHHIRQAELPLPRTLSAVRPWLRAATLWLVCIATLGGAMRLALATGVALPLPFPHLLHAHSHVALFGWMGSALTGLFYALLPVLSGVAGPSQRRITLHFRLLQAGTAGALVAFLWQGYAAVSIAFCTLHLFLWYYFAIAVRRSFPAEAVAHSPALLLMKLSVGFLVLSSLGTWALPFVMTSTGPSTTVLKTLSIDFFVHTFADGWLLPAVLALVLVSAGRHRDADGTAVRRLRLNLLLYIPAVVVSSLRGTAHAFPEPVQWLAAGAGVLLGVLHLHQAVLFRREFLHPALRAFAVFFLAKAVLDLAAAVPAGQELLATRAAVIAYLHIKLLGIASIGVIAALYTLSPPRTVHRAVPVVFTGGVAAMSVSLLLLCLPVVPAVLRLLPDIDPGMAVTTGQYGALAASVVLLVAGAALPVGYRRHRPGPRDLALTTPVSP